MRRLTTPEVVRELMVSLGRAAKEPVEVFFTGGVTAILHGWRQTTIDVDVKLVGAEEAVLRALPALKKRLGINIELAAPDEFIPELSGWRERCIFIGREGKASFFHYDLYAQALEKIERGHTQDLFDVEHMMADELIEREKLHKLFERIRPDLYRYPAIDPDSFARRLGEALER